MLKIAKAVQAASAACRSLTGGDGATHNNSLLGSILSATMIFSATIIHLPFYRSAQQSHNKPTVVRDTRQKTNEIALFHCQSNEESTDAVSKKNQVCWSKNVIQEQWSCHFGLKWYQTHMGERSKQSKPNYGDTTRRKPCQPFWDTAQGNWPEGREGTHRTLLLGATYTHYSKASQLCLSLQVLLVNMMQGDGGVGDAFWGGTVSFCDCECFGVPSTCVENRWLSFDSCEYQGGLLFRNQRKKTSKIDLQGKCLCDNAGGGSIWQWWKYLCR